MLQPKNHHLKKSAEGYTLLELLIVAILAFILIVAVIYLKGR